MNKNIALKGSKRSNRFIVEAGIILSVLALVSIPAFVNAAVLNRQLEVGSRGADVSALQTFLAGDVSLYPQGLVTGYFGFLTKAAVSNFQSRNGISPVGRVGPATLPVLNFQMANGMNTGADVSAPVVRTVNVNNVSSTTVAVNWTTNDLARSKVYYSASPIRLSNTFDDNGINFVEPNVSGTLAYYDSVLRTAQSVNISGLMPNTTYFYLVEVMDSSNNVSITLPASFRTTN